MSARSCVHCHRDDHHAPECPELRWPDGHLRGTVHPNAMPPIGPLEPGKQLPLHQESPIGEEMSRIFAGSTEKMIERHLREARARAAAS